MSGSKDQGGMAMEVAGQGVEVFKKPLQPAPHRKKKVLDEETYVRELEKIIERDFFPDLDNLKERMEYIEAKESNNVGKLRALFKKYASEGNSTGLRSIENSPATFETPVEDKGYSTPATHRSRDEDSESLAGSGEEGESNRGSVGRHEMSLDVFLDKHTSEDNESFEELMQDNERRFRQKHAWMFEAEEKHNKDHTPNLALPTAEQQAEASVLAITGVSPEKDTRPKQVENWKFKTFNSVMFVPNGEEMSKDKQIEAGKQKQQGINLQNTRFDGNPFTETLSAAAMLEASAVQASKKEGKVGVDGRELGKDSPRVNGYNFVTAPSPVPGVDASPLMTWGEVEGTPCQLDGSQTPLLKKHTPGPSYRIPQLPSRDRIGHKLSEQASQKHRNKKQKAMMAAKQGLASPLVRFGGQTSQERVMSMSPAAQKLLKAKVRMQHGTDKSLQASYTPSPSVRRTPATPGAITPCLGELTSSIRSITPKLPTRMKRTPLLGSEEAEISSGLTDNLLDLPKRQKKSPARDGSGAEGPRKCAADFF